MLKQLLQTSALITAAIVLAGCNIDNTSAPVYSTGSQVRTNNQIISTPVYSTGSQQVAPVTGSVGRSLPGARHDEYNGNNVVSSSAQAPAVAAPSPVQPTAVSQPRQPVVAVTTHRVINASNGSVPAAIPVVNSAQEEPIIRSTPSTD